MIDKPDASSIRYLVAAALAEDIGAGDVTAALVPDHQVSASVITRELAVICGVDYVNAVFHAIDPAIQLEWLCQDGEEVQANTVLFRVKGRAPCLLTAERTALNFLQTLSGVATVVRAYAQALEGSGTLLLDTRKTIPGLRLAEKYAVRCGGGINHRLGLYDAYLIKENHIAAAGGIKQVVERARALNPSILLEVEVETLVQLKEAIDSGVDRVMLDNFTVSDMKKAVLLTAKRVPLEVSGGIDVTNIRAIANLGIDMISVGALTKHIRAIDLSMRFEPIRSR